MLKVFDEFSNPGVLRSTAAPSKRSRDHQGGDGAQVGVHRPRLTQRNMQKVPDERPTSHDHAAIKKATGKPARAAGLGRADQTWKRRTCSKETATTTSPTGLAR